MTMLKFSRKKAMIFLIDVIVGIILGMTVLVMANVYFSALNIDTLPSVQIERIGSDIVKSLYNEGYFNLDLKDISPGGGLDQLKQQIIIRQPYEVNISLEVTYNSSPSSSIYTIELENIPLRDNLIIGTRFVVIKDPVTNEITDYARVRYYVWPR